MKNPFWIVLDFEHLLSFDFKYSRGLLDTVNIEMDLLYLKIRSFFVLQSIEIKLEFKLVLIF